MPGESPAGTHEEEIRKREEKLKELDARRNELEAKD